MRPSDAFYRAFGRKPPKDLPVTAKRSPACADVNFYALRLRDDRRRKHMKLRANLFDYIPAAKIPMPEMCLSPSWNVQDEKAIAFLVEGEKLQAWDAILLPDATFLLLLPEGKGNSMIETSEDEAVREKWAVMTCPGVPFDVVICGANDTKASEWTELYFGDINENKRKSG